MIRKDANDSRREELSSTWNNKEWEKIKKKMKKITKNWNKITTQPVKNNSNFWLPIRKAKISNWVFCQTDNKEHIPQSRIINSKIHETIACSRFLVDMAFGQFWMAYFQNQWTD